MGKKYFNSRLKSLDFRDLWSSSFWGNYTIYSVNHKLLHYLSLWNNNSWTGLVTTESLVFFFQRSIKISWNGNVYAIIAFLSFFVFLFVLFFSFFFEWWIVHFYYAHLFKRDCLAGGGGMSDLKFTLSSISIGF